MIYLIISILLAIIAGGAKAIQDICSESSFYQSKLFIKYNFKDSFWYKPISSKNKWKNWDKLQGEKFWGSSRWFVMFTDGWHLMDSIRTLFTFLLGCLSIIVLKWYLVPLIIMLTVFEIIYKWLKIKK